MFVPTYRSISRGFTILELSIVLVILGLLMGGILAGQSLIRSAQLQSIVTEKDRYTTAVNGFKEKYQQLPGDFTRAYQVWGTACGTNTTALSTGCNGDGDGWIESIGNDGLANIGENVKTWEHLSRAGMIEGSYDGTGTDDGGGMIVLSSAQIPASKLSGGYWDINNDRGNLVGSFPLLGTDTVNKNILTFGGLTAGDNALNVHPNLTRGEAYGIDVKTDDGKANTGAVQGDGLAECMDNGTDYYNLRGTLIGGDHTSTDCLLHFIL